MEIRVCYIRHIHSGIQRGASRAIVVVGILCGDKQSDISLLATIQRRKRFEPQASFYVTSVPKEVRPVRRTDKALAPVSGAGTNEAGKYVQMCLTGRPAKLNLVRPVAEGEVARTCQDRGSRISPDLTPPSKTVRR